MWTWEIWMKSMNNFRWKSRKNMKGNRLNWSTEWWTLISITISTTIKCLKTIESVTFYQLKYHQKLLYLNKAQLDLCNQHPFSITTTNTSLTRGIKLSLDPRAVAIPGTFCLIRKRSDRTTWALMLCTKTTQVLCQQLSVRYQKPGSLDLCHSLQTRTKCLICIHIIWTVTTWPRIPGP